MTVTDDSHEVEWQAGAGGVSVPVVSASAQRFTGRVCEMSARKGLRLEYGQFVRIAGGRHLPFVGGRELIKMVAEEQGWAEGLSGNQKVVL